jgi:S1-C subfamily serine protease
MKRHPLSVLLWPFLFVLIVGLACGIPAGTEEPVDKPVEASPTPADTGVTDEQESAGEPAPAAVSNLQDVQGAVIQIEAQGTFVDPEWGQYSGAGRGSGFIIDPSGIAVTNNHVVTGAALLKVWVGGDTSQTYNARVLGVSECSDLAVIDIDGDGFPFLEWYDSPIQVGLEVYTAGFPLGEPEYTLTKGIVSKESTNGETNWASVDSVLMHDATINPGNSGGPLIDASGKVVGVNYAAYKAADQYFAIGKDVAVPLVKTLQGGQNVDSVGINGTAVVSDDGSQSGIWVSSVASGSPADKAGITGGDILMTVEGFPIAADGTMSDYCDILRTHTENDIISVEVLRYMTQEYLEGQLNGPALSVVESFDVPTEEIVEGEAPAFYVEEFDPDSSNVQYWSWFLTNGDENGFDIYTEGGKLVFDITGKHIYSYFAYDPYFYEDVRLDAIAENRGMNNNNVSLICRATDEGWYEFSIANNGLWWIYGYDGDYSMLANGGSTAVNMGKDVNEYTILCYGDTLALYINGNEIHTLHENNFAFREGQVGIGVSSFDVLPIIVEFDWVAISESMQ